MAVDTPAKIVVLGAGPIGLEAALYARFLGYEVVVFERGPICGQVLAWKHVRMYTPFRMNRSLLGWAAIQAHDEAYEPPPDEAYLTGEQWVEGYLLPLSQTDLLADHLRLQTEVLAVGKEELRKRDLPGHEDRGDWSFRVLVRDSTGEERIELADVVIDATGVLGQPNWLGHGGMPAIGERALRDQIEYRFPDFAGRDHARYAGRHTLLVDESWLTALNVLALAELARETPGTRVTWIAHSEPNVDSDRPFPPLQENDETHRGRLSGEAIALAASGADWLQYWSRTVVEAVRPAAPQNGIEVVLSGEHSGTFRYDAIIANVGFRPDRGLYRELQVGECPATEGMARPPRDVAQPERSGRIQPEPNFYVLGAKSGGRSDSFLFVEGLEQIRKLFTIIGDRETLDLYAGAKSLLRPGK